MRNITVFLSTILAVLTILPFPTTIDAATADDSPRVRYGDPSGLVTLSVSHEIEVVRDEPIEAGRSFDFELSLGHASADGAVTVTIDGARARSAAHGTTQRLGTRHLRGSTFPLAIEDGGRRLGAPDDEAAPRVGLGPMVEPGFSVATLLADTLPLLPEETVQVGTHWTTERAVRSLEGWGWGRGTLSGRHRVTGVERRGAHTVVQVTTEATANLAADGERGWAGELARTVDWSFDATDGRLLTLELDQRSDGTCGTGQGKFRVRQHTRVELSPRAAG
jgi:hypothetical protein